MIFLWLIIGLALPTAIGWLLLSMLEWRTPVLSTAERCVCSALLGLTFTMYMIFLGTITLGIPLSLRGMAGVQVALIALLAVLRALLFKRGFPRATPLPSTVSKGRPRGIILAVLLCLLTWSAVKIAGGTFMLVSTPVYLDDTAKNWNMRGKQYFFTEKLWLLSPFEREGDTPTGIHSYPPSAPLAKTWLANLAGEWDEGLVNTPHLFWLLSALALVFFAIRREAGITWALAGIYLLSSLPLFLIHGTNAYADVFLAAHIFAALWFLFCALCTKDGSSVASFLRLAGFAMAVLTFTKNEGFGLYFPPLLLFFGIVIALQIRRGLLSKRTAVTTIAIVLGLIAAILLPWLLFKWMHGLAFGNAKPITGLTFGWQEGVMISIFINTFFEGNWLLLFPLLLLLLAMQWRAAFRSPLALFTCYFLLLYCAQIPLFLFTELSYEALMQTGYARGLIHLMPVVVTLAVILLQKLVQRTGSL